MISCQKEGNTLISQYQNVLGEWKTQSVSYDSSGITITKSIRYDRLIINDDLSYQIRYDSLHTIENGTVEIISQSKDKLEIYFASKYPIFSSFAGSHIFGFSNVVLISISNDDMILKSVDVGYLSYSKFHFKRNYHILD